MLASLRYSLFVFFAIFSVSVISPICILRPFNAKNGRLFFQVFSWFMYWTAGIKLNTEGVEIIEKHHPAVLIGNHQHNYDVISVSQLFVGHVVVLGKFEIGLIPIFGQIYVLCGNILIKRGNRKKAMQSMQILEQRLLKKKLSVLIFPEGHRNAKKELLPFKKGAYYTAVRTQSPLIPFSISQFANHCDFNKFKRITIHIKVHPPVQTTGCTNKDIPELIAKTRATIEDGIAELNKNYI